MDEEQTTNDLDTGAEVEGDDTKVDTGAEVGEGEDNDDDEEDDENEGTEEV